MLEASVYYGSQFTAVYVSGWFSKLSGSPSESELSEPLVLWEQKKNVYIQANSENILPISHCPSVVSMDKNTFYITWFRGQSCCPNLCPVFLWTPFLAMPILPDSKWSQIKNTDKIKIIAHVYSHYIKTQVSRIIINGHTIATRLSWSLL